MHVHVHVVSTFVANNMQWKHVTPVINRTGAGAGAVIVMTEVKSVKQR